MRWLTWIGIIALSSANFIGCADGGSETSSTTNNQTGGNGGSSTSQGGTAGTAQTGGMGGAGGMGSGGDATGGGGGAGGFVPLGPLTYTGVINDGFQQTPLSGVSVCALDPMIPCVSTDATGAFTYMGIPENTRVRVGASLPNYFPVEALVDTTTVDGVLSAFMIATVIIDLGLDSIGVTFDENLAAVSVTVRDLNNMPLAGYSVSVDPPAGDGPFYIDGTSILQNATETQATGTAFIVNIPFGDYSINVTGPNGCNASFINDAANQHTAPLISASQFVVVFDCQ